MNPLRIIIETWKEFIGLSEETEKRIEKEVEIWYFNKVSSNQCRCKCGCKLYSIREQCHNCRVGEHKSK